MEKGLGTKEFFRLIPLENKIKALVFSSKPP